MNWGLLITGFSLGTAKFLFAHWALYGAARAIEYDISWLELFISVTAGAWFAMAIFYYTSSLLMRKARIKRLNTIIEAEKRGIPYQPKPIFTRFNKSIVWIKRHIGIYGITLLAPLFLSVPFGSIVCAKFYRKHRRTFPLMLFFTAGYSALMCLWIYSI
ncbi:MAG: hypothetical protein WDZ35_15430 [Crocinitomicaceae bacterium]